MKSSSSVPKLGGALVALFVLFWSNQHVQGVDTKVINASSRLVSVSSMGDQLCPLPVNTPIDILTPVENIPVNPVTVALGYNVKALQPLAAAAAPAQSPERAQGQGQTRGGGPGRGAAAFTLSPGAPLPGPPTGINAQKHA